MIISFVSACVGVAVPFIASSVAAGIGQDGCATIKCFSNGSVTVVCQPTIFNIYYPMLFTGNPANPTILGSSGNKRGAAAIYTALAATFNQSTIYCAQIQANNKSKNNSLKNVYTL